jgi:hypothetical protein
VLQPQVRLASAQSKDENMYMRYGAPRGRSRAPGSGYKQQPRYQSPAYEEDMGAWGEWDQGYADDRQGYYEEPYPPQPPSSARGRGGRAPYGAGYGGRGYRYEPY